MAAVAGRPDSTKPIHRPRMLFLCQTLPYPPDEGVKVRTYNVLRLLARVFDITLVCFYRSKAETTKRGLHEASVTELGKLAQVQAFLIPQEHNLPRFIWDHLRSVLRSRAYTVYLYESREFRGCLQQLLQSGRFEVAHVDSLDLSGYLPLLEGTPVVCVHHNVESALLRRRADAEASAHRRVYLAHQASLVEHEIRAWCKRVALNVAVSEADRELLRQIAPGARFTVVPNGVDTDRYRASPGRDDGLVFVGGLTWFPNWDALQYFSSDILPLIRDGGAEPRVRWVGQAPEEVQLEYQERHKIELTGYVEDVRPYVRDAACYVVPLRVGGGTRLKILEAWAMSKAVVSTSVGCEGLTALDGENILIRDEPADFAQAVKTVLRDGNLRRRLGQKARATVEHEYSWDVVGGPMIELYLDTMEQTG